MLLNRVTKSTERWVVNTMENPAFFWFIETVSCAPVAIWAWGSRSVAQGATFHYPTLGKWPKCWGLCILGLEQSLGREAGRERDAAEPCRAQGTTGLLSALNSHSPVALAMVENTSGERAEPRSRKPPRLLLQLTLWPDSARWYWE